MKLALLAAVLTIIATVNVVTATEDVETAWKNFQIKYGKQYLSDNVSRNKKAFIDNFNTITEHNKLYEQGIVSYSLAINEFADLTNEEFRSTFNGYKKKIANLGREQIEKFIPDKTEKIPDTFDWREKGAVTPVKNQGQCGSCWAFSSTGALEGQHFRKTGKLVSISEQNLVDCSFKYNNMGCNGGLMEAAFKYVHDNDGIDSEKSYPYLARTSKCHYKLNANVTSAKGYAKIEKGNEESLKSAIATIGPIAVAIDASPKEFQHYHSGVYFSKSCHNDTRHLDHGVLAVGYGTEKNQDYWLIKNSWGESWGDKGYIKMSRNKSNNCGVATDASYPLNY